MHELGAFTGIKSRFVIGGASLTHLSASEVFTILDAAYAAGIREIDSAPMYGSAERQIGKYLSYNPDFLVNSKIGRVNGGEIRVDSIEAQLSSSLEAFGNKAINNCFIHSLPSSLWKTQEILGRLIQAKIGGEVKGIGYSGDNEDLAEALKENFNAYMFTYNYLDRTNASLLGISDFDKQIYLKRPLANAVWKMPRDQMFKYLLGIRILKKDMLDRQSYEFRYLQFLRFCNRQPINLKRLLNFSFNLGGEAKIVIGVSKLEHLKEIVRTEKEIISVMQDMEIMKWKFLEDKYGWKAVT